MRNISPKPGSAFNTRCMRSIVNVWRHVSASGVAVRGDGGVAGEGRVVGVPKFHSWGKCTMIINNYQLRLDVQRFLCPAYYIMRVL